MTEDERALHLLALPRLGLGEALARAEPGAGLPELVAAGLLGRWQADAARRWVEANAVGCPCGRRTLPPGQESQEVFACVGCGQRLARGGASQPERALSPPAPPETGGRVGPLLLGRVLGRGAFGVVYEARHEQLGREAALKVIPGAALDPRRREAFAQEVEAQARLQHPGLVAVHAVHEVGGALCLEMELVRGESLGALLQRRHRLGWREAAALLAELARAVAHAHGRGIVHRDLKPGNVLVRADGQDGARVAVVDWGLARIVDPTLSSSVGLSGTPSYLPPEAFAGRFGPPGDVWALGAVLHEALSGEPPFRAPTLLELYARIARGEAAPLELEPDAPPGLLRLRDRALRVDPAARPAAAELALDLERLLRGEPIRAERRERGRMGIAGLALVGLALLGALGWLARSGPRDPPPVARDARALLAEAAGLASADPVRALRLADEALAARPGDGDLRRAVAELHLRLGRADRAAALLGETADPLLEARLLRARGDLPGALARLGPAKEPLRVALLLELGRIDEAEAAAGTLPSSGMGGALSLAARGEVALARGELLLARERFLAALALRETAAARVGLAEAWLLLGAPEEALVAAERALAEDPLEAGARLARLAARIATDEPALAREDLAALAGLAPPGPAARELRALARDLADGRARSRLARAQLERAGLLANGLASGDGAAEPALAAARTAALAWSAESAAHRALAVALAAAGDLAAARRALSRLAELAGGEPDPVATWAAARSEPDDPDGAARAASALAGLARIGETARLGPAPFGPLRPDRLALLRARRELLAGRPAAAVDLARQALAAAGSRAARRDALGVLAAAGERAGLPGEELAHLRRELLRLEPARADARALARTRSFGSAAAALRGFEEALAREPWEPCLFALKGRRLHTEAFLDGARAAELDPDYSLQCLATLFPGRSEGMWLHGWASSGSEQAAREEEALVPLAIVALAAAIRLPPAEAAPVALKVLAQLQAAERARPGLPAQAMLRALALDLLGAPLAAKAEADRATASLARDIALGFQAFLAQRQGRLWRPLAEEAHALHAARRRLAPGDPRGMEHLLGRLGLPQPFAPPWREEPLAQGAISGQGFAALEGGGWRIEPGGELRCAIDGDAALLGLLEVGAGAGRLEAEADGELPLRFEPDAGDRGAWEVILAAGLVPGPQGVRLRASEGAVVIRRLWLLR